MKTEHAKPDTLSASAALVAPRSSGDLLSYSSRPNFNLAAFPEFVKETATRQGNFNSFLAACEEGEILQRVLALTSNRNFLSETLGALVKNAGFRNKLVEIFHGQDLVHSLGVVPWLGMIIDTFTFVPNFRNQPALAAAQDSLFDFGALASSSGEFQAFAEAIGKGANTSEIQGSELLSSGIKVKIFANGSEVKPAMIDGDATVLEVDGKRYYNGLPSDRSRFPTVALPEGAKIEIELTNSSSDVLMVVPTINGIPLRTEHIYMGIDGFAESNLPLIGIKPHSTYLKPGETLKVSDFSCNQIAISKAKTPEQAFESYLGTIGEYSDSGLLMPLIGKAFLRTLPESSRKLINDPDLTAEQKAALENIILASKEEYLKKIFKMLNQGGNASWRSEVIVQKPQFPDGSSDTLANPMLGTIGIAVLKITAPVKSEFYGTPINLSGAMFRGGGDGMRSMGGAGLASIGGGAGYSGARLNSDWRHADGIHTFQGFIPLNLMSLTE